jgi:hypothetical protein
MITTVGNRTEPRYDPLPLLRQCQLILQAPNEEAIANSMMDHYGQNVKWQQVADFLGVSHKMIMRWLHDGHWIRESAAERYAQLLELHPSLLWPEWWDDCENDPRPRHARARAEINA